jgi:hypothetical protein
MSARRAQLGALVLAGSALAGAELSVLTTTDAARGLANDVALWVTKRHRTIPAAPVGGTVVVSGLAPGAYVLGSPEHRWPGWSLEPQRFDLPDVELHRLNVRWVRTEDER